MLAVSSGPVVSTQHIRNKSGITEVGGGGGEGKPRPRDSPGVGSVVSLVLRLKKRKNGASQTQIAKNVAISPNAGGRTTGPPRLAWCAA
jgi:hypothetical protein